MTLGGVLGTTTAVIVQFAIYTVLMAIGFYIYYRVERRAIVDALTEYSQGYEKDKNNSSEDEDDKTKEDSEDDNNDDEDDEKDND